VKIRGLAPSGIDGESFGTQSGHSLEPCACSLGDLPHGLLIEVVPIAKGHEYTDHAALPSDGINVARKALQPTVGASATPARDREPAWPRRLLQSGRACPARSPDPPSGDRERCSTRR